MFFKGKSNVMFFLGGSVLMFNFHIIYDHTDGGICSSTDDANQSTCLLQ